MSTILKALKRLDEQRRAELSPRTLEQQVLAGGVAAGAADRNKWRFVAGGAAGVMLLAGAGWLALREPKPAPPMAPLAPAAPARVAAAPPRALPSWPARSALPAQGAPIAGTELDAGIRAGMHVAPAREDVAPVSALPPSGRQPEGELAAPALAAGERLASAALQPSAPPPLGARAPSGFEAPPMPTPAPQRQGGVLAARARGRPAPEPVRKPFAAAAPRAAQQVVARESDAASTARGETQASAPVPEAAVAPAPEVWVERTQWHPTPAKRSALVRIGADAEARELREGDTVDGVVVKEIRPSGVVFLHEGSEFKRSVGAVEAGR